MIIRMIVCRTASAAVAMIAAMAMRVRMTILLDLTYLSARMCGHAYSLLYILYELLSKAKKIILL